MERLSRNAPALLLAAAAIATVVFTLVVGSHASFYADTWDTLMNRRDPSVDAWLQPHNEHWVMFPVIITQICLRLFGMTSTLPEYVVLSAFLVAAAVLLYVYVKRRLGPWFGLYAAVLLLFLGPAFEVLLWPFEISFCGPIVCGLAMLLALEREDRRGDVAACVLLTLSLGFSSLGVPFIVGAAVAILIGPRSTWRSRAFVVVIPALVFAAWYLGWGHDAESHASLRNALAAPRYVAEALAISLGSLVGLGASPEGPTIDPTWGRALFVAIAVAIGWLLYHRPRVSPGLWPILAVAGANWILAALNSFAGREPTASRYQYAGAVFLLMILANLAPGWRPRRWQLIAGAVVTVLAIGPNLVVLKSGGNFIRDQAVLTRSDTAALEIARRTVDPAVQLNPEIAGTPTLVNVFAGLYFEAVDEYGSPAYSIAELAAAPESGRRQADVVLASALPVTSETRAGRAGKPSAGCVSIASGAPEVEVVDGSRVETGPGGVASLALRRFAQSEYPVELPILNGDSTMILRIPPDHAQEPWFVDVEAPGEARVCPPR